MREQGFMAKTVCITIRDNELMSFNRQHTTEIHTNLTKDITNTAIELFKKSYKMEKPLRSSGVSVTDFIHDDQPHQMSLLRDEKRLIQNEQLDKTLDRLKKRFGNYAVRPAVLLDDKELSDFNPRRIIQFILSDIYDNDAS